MTFLDIHVLQAMPPSGPAGGIAIVPEGLAYGGVPRATMSAAHWRSAVREGLRRAGTGGPQDVPASARIARAVSTHEMAPDDLAAGPGGSAAVLYRYASLGLWELAAELDAAGARSGAVDLAIAVARAFVTEDPYDPGGGHDADAETAPCPRPDFALLVVREDQPVSLAGAFEEPVKAERGGLLPGSAIRMTTYLADQDRMYGTSPLRTTVACPAWLADRIREAGAYLPDLSCLGGCLGRVRATLAARVAEG